MISRYFPILKWGGRYSPALLADDALAAAIVTIMLIPQSLAYAMIAGLPPEVGLYASMAPLVAYAIFGTSNTLAVGPVAVVSLMTASAVGRIVETGGPDYIAAAAALAVLSGLMLTALGLLRLGFLANFLSHPTIAGFIAASGVLIAASQLKHILGAWRIAPRHCREPRLACRGNKSDHARHRRRLDPVSVAGAGAFSEASARHWIEGTARVVGRQGRPAPRGHRRDRARRRVRA